MARNSIDIPVPPGRVFEVLSDPRSYGEWVVGSSQIRDADPNWPAVGSRFHHKVGWGPIKVSDHTEVLDADPPRMLRLRAKARPLGTALVTLGIAETGGGSRVTMIEDPGDRLSALIFSPLTHLLVRGRNVESLRRLRDIAVQLDQEPAAADRRLGESAQP
ncbi:SRPBCC family protein [Thermoleophilia bacterium SCSIO 60948]|nr:SRPBCC family protein [Thermoleophilia bacterium SCSIO 60948]